jgi:hypothetical protein
MTGHGMRELIRGQLQYRSLTFYGMRAGLLLVVGLLCLAAGPVSAQHSMRVRIDTVTGNPGDTVLVNVYYTFTGTLPFDLHAFNAKFSYDTALVYIADYVSSGTASSAIPIFDKSHLGVVFYASSGTDIDFANPVLFRMKVAIKQSLSDTAWIRWVAFGTDEPVDSEVEQDGSVRTQVTAAHTVLTAKSKIVSGVSSGYFPDSVRFTLPVMISDISAANVTSAELRFKYDERRLAFVAAHSTSNLQTQIARVSKVEQTANTVTVDLQASGEKILGADTLVNLDFYALVGIDTVCTGLDSVRWTPLNSDAKRGATEIAFDSICLYGRLGTADVEIDEVGPVRLYPNPARDFVLSAGADIENLKVFDAFGRLVALCELNSNVWTVPASFRSGLYRVVVTDRVGRTTAAALVIER